MSFASFFQIRFKKNSLRNAIIVSSSLDPDQDRHSVGPDLHPNRLQRLSGERSGPAVECLT